MFDSIVRANLWYDRQEEPFRFLMFFIPLLISGIVGVFMIYFQIGVMMIVIILRLYYFNFSTIRKKRIRAEAEK